MRFETKHEPLAPLSVFLFRLFQCFMFGVLIIVIGLFIGMLGYHYLEGQQWINAFLNAAVMLSDMGIVDVPHTFFGKLFAAFYALFSGLIFVSIIGVIFAPIFHRFFHRFHLDNPSAYTVSKQ